MLKYDAKTRTLKGYKIVNPEIDMDVLADQKASYVNYRENGVYEDIQYMIDYLTSRYPDSVKGKTFEIVKPYKEYKYGTSLSGAQRHYYSYSIRIIGFNSSREVEVFRLPYMDSMCKLNCNGSLKVLINELKPAMGVSYVSDSNTLNLVLPHTAINIATTSTGITFRIGKNMSTSLADLAIAKAYVDGVTDYDWTVYRNSYLLQKINMSPSIVSEAFAKAPINVGILNLLQSATCSLGEARDSINESLSIDSAIGYVLSRDVGGYKAGTAITQECIRDLKRKRINLLYVKDIPNIVGMKLDNPVMIQPLPAGFEMLPYMEVLFPNYEGYDYLPKDTSQVFINPGTVITEEMLDFLLVVGIPFVSCRTSKDTAMYYFEREIVGNYTARLGELTDDIPDGRSPYEWVYYYNNENLEPCEHDYLTVHDLSAILSLCASIYRGGNNVLYDKDKDFLKRVCMASETFSDFFKRAVRDFCLNNIAIGSFLAASSNSKVANPFFRFMKRWLSLMVSNGILQSTDTINILAELTQANHVSIILGDKHAATREMQELSIYSYGRICPYETPAGSKLGLVNTKALGAKVFNGILKSPYRRVIKDGNGIRISNTVDYLDSRDEIKFKIGDILSLKKDVNGNYLNTKVKARIPNPDIWGKDKVVYEYIHAYDLDYVNAHTEQYLSLSASLIPFLCADDAVRVSYGISMIRQAVSVLKSQVPSVLTSTYKKIHKYSNMFYLDAEDDGVVVDIGNDELYVQYNNRPDETVYSIPECRVTNDSITVLNYKFLVGEHFHKGDSLVESSTSKEGFFTQGRDALVGYIHTGWNYEDAIHMSEKASVDYTTIHTRKVKYNPKRKYMNTTTIASPSDFRYVGKNDKVCSAVVVSNVGSAKSSSHFSVKTKEESGLFYHLEREEIDNKVEYTCYLLDMKKPESGDKFAGRHGNKGVASQVSKTSQVPILMNGLPLDFILNPSGVPSRMNVGQILELHTGLIAHVLQIRIETDAINSMDVDEIAMLMKYTHFMANVNSVQEASAGISKFPFIDKSLHEHVISIWDEVHDWSGCFDEYGDAQLYDPLTDTFFEEKITIGYAYMMPLVQDGDHKKNYRGGMLTEKYMLVDQQPTRGAKNSGGQSMAEMELMALVAYGVKNYLNEVLTSKSDDVLKRLNEVLKSLDIETDTDSLEDSVPRATEMLIYYLAALGVKLDVSNEEVLQRRFDKLADVKVLPNMLTLISNQNGKVDVSGASNDIGSFEEVLDLFNFKEDD